MKKYYFVITLIIVGFVISISSCKKDDIPPFTESVILIDSIIHPDTVALGSQLPIKFYGIIGNGCDSFLGFEELPLDEGEYTNTFKIQFYRRTQSGVSCTEEIKNLGGSQLNLSGMLAGNFVIKVVQPDGSYLEGLVFVEE